jgi:hypothetical protein
VHADQENDAADEPQVKLFAEPRCQSLSLGLSQQFDQRLVKNVSALFFGEVRLIP